jgi:hypothetical protein
MQTLRDNLADHGIPEEVAQQLVDMKVVSINGGIVVTSLDTVLPVGTSVRADFPNVGTRIWVVMFNPLPIFGADNMPDAVFTSMPSLSKAAMAICRKWQQLPDALNDDDALAQGLISPDQLALIMQIIQDVMQNCLPNSRGAALQRLRGYTNNAHRPTDRLGDQIRLNWTIDRWMGKLAIPRETGDVVAVRRAIEDNANGIEDQKFYDLQTEVLWLTI